MGDGGWTREVALEMTGDGQIRDAFCRLSPRSLLTVGRELGCNDRADSGAVRCAERTAGQAGLG